MQLAAHLLPLSITAGIDYGLQIRSVVLMLMEILLFVFRGQNQLRNSKNDRLHLCCRFKRPFIFFQFQYMSSRRTSRLDWGMLEFDI